jgi:hypothetical protein
LTKIGLIDIDSKIPNLVLMKLSAWHKAQGDDVELTTPVFAPIYDKAYASQVFTWTQTPCLPEGVAIGGTGVDLKTTLPEEIESLCPDYTLYKMDYSIGFLTRGCIRKCSFCFVPEKEGTIRPAADIEDFLRHKKAILLDNNVLACDHGIEQIEKIARLGIKVDFNQGLDARLIDNVVAKKLAAVKWIRAIRLACDNEKQKVAVEKAVKNLRRSGFTREVFCYMLVTEDTDEAYDRAMFLKGLKVDPFAMPYRSPDGSLMPKQSRVFANWVNKKAEFKSCDWYDYRWRLQEC